MTLEEPQHNLDKVEDWSPERKIVGAAVATVILWVAQLVFSVDAPIGIEGAVAVLAAYFIPNKKS